MIRRTLAAALLVVATLLAAAAPTAAYMPNPQPVRPDPRPQVVNKDLLRFQLGLLGPIRLRALPAGPSYVVRQYRNEEGRIVICRYFYSVNRVICYEAS